MFHYNNIVKYVDVFKQINQQKIGTITVNNNFNPSTFSPICNYYILIFNNYNSYYFQSYYFGLKLSANNLDPMLLLPKADDLL